MHWTTTIARLPFVCERCSRRFPHAGRCHVKLTDQSGLLAKHGITPRPDPSPAGWWE